MESTSRQSDSKNKQKRRRFSKEEKFLIVEEADTPGVVFQSIARKHGVQPNQIYSWRKQLRADKFFTPADCSEIDARAMLNKTLNRIAELERDILVPVSTKLKSDVKNGEISAYNATNGALSIVNAFCKLEGLRIDVADKISALPKEELNAEPFDRERERLAEQLLVQFLDNYQSQNGKNENRFIGDA